MRKSVTLVVCILLMGALAWGAADRKRVAILDFDFGTVQRWWDANWDIGKGIADLIVTELVEDGTYRVIERKQLDAILAEQNFSNSNRADASTAAHIGKVLGVDAIIVGSITKFGAEQKKFGLGGIGGKFGGFGGGRVGTSKGKAVVAIDARVIDVDTAEILAVAKGEGESSRSGLLLQGVGVGGGGFGAGGIDMGSSDFRETIIGEAVYKAVEQLAQGLISAEPKLPTRKVEIRGLVADVAGTTVTLNVGSAQGLSPGDTLVVLRVVRTIKDPASGQVLREVTEEVAQVRLDEVEEGFSVGTLVNAQGEVKVGDIVRNQD